MRPGDETCVYLPDEVLTYWDENDIEHETNEPAEDCGSFSCNKCGYTMMYGDIGWFDLRPPHKPLFNYCPNCGRRVRPMKPYDLAVDDDRGIATLEIGKDQHCCANCKWIKKSARSDAIICLRSFTDVDDNDTCNWFEVADDD